MPAYSDSGFSTGMIDAKLETLRKVLQTNIATNLRLMTGDLGKVLRQVSAVQGVPFRSIFYGPHSIGLHCIIFGFTSIRQ